MAAWETGCGGVSAWAAAIGLLSAQVLAQGVLYVDQTAIKGANTGATWDDAYLCLQDALDHARVANVDGDFGPNVAEIWIAQGTYTPDRGTKDPDMTFALVDGVALYGGFAGGEMSVEERDWLSNPTILSGELRGEANSCQVVTAGNLLADPPIPAVSSATILDGVTIRGGHAACGGALDYGGGLYSAGGDPTIRNVTFADNFGLFGGGALHLSGASPIIENTVFTGNSTNFYGGAVGAFAGSRPAFHDCTFTGNHSGFVGAGIYLIDLGSHATIIACHFAENTAASGAAVTATSHAAFTIKSSTFIDNAATGVAGAIRTNVHAESLVEKSLFRGNVSGIGGGAMRISTDFSNVVKVNVRDCLFLDNAATGQGLGGAIYAVNWKGDFINNIVAGNSGAFASSLNIINTSTGGGAQMAPRIINSTLVDNSGGPAISVQKAQPRFWNTIVRHEGPQPMATIDSALVTLEHCNVATVGFAWIGTNNIDVEPHFYDIESDDFRLVAGCDSIDAGSNALVPGGVLTDINGDPRIQDGDGSGIAVVNIGATETVVHPASACIGDLNGDGFVNVFDLLELLASWGPTTGETEAADLDADGVVNVFDLLILLSAWGPCP